MLRHALSLCFGAFLLLGLAASTTAAAPQHHSTSNRTVLNIAYAGASTDFFGLGLSRFKSDVEKSAAANDVDVQLYFSSVLGSGAATYDATRLGTIKGWVDSSIYAEATLPQFGVFDLPYIFNGPKGYSKVVDNKAIRTSFSNALAGTGLHLLGFWSGGERDLYTASKPVRKPSDLKGMKIRILNSPVYNYFWSAMGAQPTPIPFGDVYLALSQGTLNGAETAWASAIGAKHDEVAKYWIKTGHAWGMALFVVNAAWFNTLSKADQAGIQAAANDATKYQRAQAISQLAATTAKLKSEGKTVIIPDTKAFRFIARGVWKHFSSTYGKATINQVLHVQGLKRLP
jgi:tripartite ATP-independent transporter DctP family solute receptor